MTLMTIPLVTHQVNFRRIVFGPSYEEELDVSSNESLLVSKATDTLGAPFIFSMMGMERLSVQVGNNGTGPVTIQPYGSLWPILDDTVSGNNSAMDDMIVWTPIGSPTTIASGSSEVFTFEHEYEYIGFRGNGTVSLPDALTVSAQGGA